MNKQELEKRLKELPKLIDDAASAIVKAEIEVKEAQRNKAELEKEFKELKKAAKRTR